MARQIRQTLPQPGKTYDQGEVAQIAAAVQRYMFQAQAPAEVVAARFIMVDQPTSTVGLAVGTLYLKNIAGVGLVVSVVQEGDP